MATPETMQVTVACAPGPRQVHLLRLEVPVGCTVQYVLSFSLTLEPLKATDFGLLVPGIRGRKVAPDCVVQAGDRIDLCRPLTVDPKVARRQRFARQGAKTAGLFSKRRQGAKAGY